MTLPKITNDRIRQIKSHVEALGDLDEKYLTSEELLLIDAWTLYVREHHALSIVKARARELLVKSEHMRLQFKQSFDKSPEDEDTVVIDPEELERRFARRAQL